MLSNRVMTARSYKFLVLTLTAVGAGAGLPERVRAEPAGLVAALSPVQVATEAAVGDLKQQIDRLPLGQRISVGQFLDSVNGHDGVLRTLRQAEVIGGPRLLEGRTESGGGQGGPQVVQIRLDIRAAVVAEALTQAAVVNGRKWPYTAEFVAIESRAWSDRTFTATGTSLPRVSAPSPAEAASPAAIEAAKLSAANGVVERFAQLTLPRVAGVSGGPFTGRDLLAIDGVRQSLLARLMAVKPSAVSSRSDGTVSVTVPVDRAAFAQAVKSAVKSGASSSSSAAAPVDEAGWSEYREAILAGLPAEAQGVAVPQPDQAAGKGDGATSLPAISLNLDKPPAWFFRTLEGTGSAGWAGSKLRTARLAEDAAAANLKQQIGALELAPAVTFQAAADRDPRLAEVISRATERSRVTRIDYGEDGSATVGVSTDARYIWQDLARQVSHR